MSSVEKAGASKASPCSRIRLKAAKRNAPQTADEKSRRSTPLTHLPGGTGALELALDDGRDSVDARLEALDGPSRPRQLGREGDDDRATAL